MSASNEALEAGGVLALPTAEFVAHLDASCARAIADRSIVPLLMLGLRQTDRIGALIGSQESQRMIRMIHARLRAVLQPGERYCVVAADEIWIALRACVHPEFATVAAHRVLRALEQSALTGVDRADFHPCIGIACAPLHATTSAALLAAADIARRTAQMDESALVMFQPAQMASRADPVLFDELRAAIHANQLTVHYQPLVDLRSGRCHAVEALLRWTRASGEVIAPLTVAEVCERTDLVYPLTQLVLNTALRNLEAFHRDRIHVGLSVNLSARLIGDNDLPELVLQLLGTWGIEPHHLTLEVTETAWVTASRKAEAMLAALKEGGVRLAMDDFGTGYSSLLQLKRFPFDEVKIDKVFVQDMVRDAGDQRIVRAMIDLAHGFDMGVVAEGIEDEATLHLLGALGCDIAQGYVIAKPMPEAAFRKWWNERLPDGHPTVRRELQQLGGEAPELLV